MPARKRAAPATPVASGRRRSGRISSSVKKSQYFEADSDSESEDPRASKRVKSSGGRGRKKVESDDEEDYDDAPDEDEDEDDGGEDDEQEGDEDEEEPKVKSRGAKGNGVKKSGSSKRKMEAQEGHDEGPNSDDYGEVFIPHKQLRDTDGVDYEDHRVHKNTLLFLKDLKANNKRSWLKDNDPEFRRSLKDWNSYVETLTQKIIEADTTVPELPVKDLVFRIYRDVRFSKDQTPYKPHYSAAWSRTGRKGPYACYYLHAEPGACYVGGGLWHPEAPQVALLRASIDERPRRWRRVLCDEAFRRTFLPKAKAGDEKGILREFAAGNKANALKTRPKGFGADHRDIELLKLRNFTVGKKIPDHYVTDEDGQEKVMGVIEAMVGFVTHLNNVVMPDPDSSDEESDNEEDAGTDASPGEGSDEEE